MLLFPNRKPRRISIFCFIVNIHLPTTRKRRAAIRLQQMDLLTWRDSEDSHSGLLTGTMIVSGKIRYLLIYETRYIYLHHTFSGGGTTVSPRGWSRRGSLR